MDRLTSSMSPILIELACSVVSLISVSYHLCSDINGVRRQKCVDVSIFSFKFGNDVIVTSRDVIISDIGFLIILLTNI
jgi:hypothetical protein